MKLSEKLSKLQVGKYYYTAEYASYNRKENDPPVRESWWKLISNNEKRAAFSVISSIRKLPFDYQSLLCIDVQEVFYKDHEWIEIPEEEFVAQVEEFKCQLNELIITKP